MDAVMKQGVLQNWQDRAARVQAEIKEIKLQLEQYRYEQEITQRLLAQAQDESARQTWQTQVDVMDMMIMPAEDKLIEEQEYLILCQAMIAQIEADLAA